MPAKLWRSSKSKEGVANNKQRSRIAVADVCMYLQSIMPSVMGSIAETHFTQENGMLILLLISCLWREINKKKNKWFCCDVIKHQTSTLPFPDIHKNSKPKINNVSIQFSIYYPVAMHYYVYSEVRFYYNIECFPLTVGMMYDKLIKWHTMSCFR
jgi:hypothetical protein